ncbi:CBN-ETR-1 protein [Caenorhabditis brenneri]|uniref:CBN-ETR-1 protein n=1 Tax=Caenorhabditis brenneri TaxID=135651 RepID=G0N4N4_CAEBE|nr:CBN-ETR-1 protein [Caenorhabditis brenneri]
MSGVVLPALHLAPKMEQVLVAETIAKDALSTTDNDVSPSPSEPDSDTIKMFVGQIPRNWNEVDCRRLFEQYGPVFSCNILRDKSTQASKGCCFVTFFHRKDAIEAQGALHNIKVIEGMHHPVQMKPADTENRNERKLFIGQLSKKHNEENLREIFSKYGQIEDCSVLRDQDGKSRGCAFVTFTNRSCAVVATKEMHHSQTMEGCSAPLVVKFADTQKDKDVKTKSLITGNGGGSPKGASNLLHNLNPALLQQLGGGQNYQAVASLLSLMTGQQGQQQQQQQNVLGILGSVLSALGKLTENPDDGGKKITTPLMSTEKSRNASLLTSPPPPIKSTQSPALANPVVSSTHSHHHHQQLGQNQQQHGLGTQLIGNPTAAVAAQNQFDALAMAQIAHHQNQMLALQGFAVQQSAPTQQQSGIGGALAGAKTSPVAATLANHQSIALTPFAGGAAALDHFTAMQQQYALLANLQATSGVGGVPATSSSVGSQMVGNGDVRGPDGANLFIYHLPQDFGDTDLINTFAPFGAILSAKVFIDKVTNLSKCYGFVSFENPQSATNAISAMNGFQIGSKRLKVQLKVDRGHPYNR